MLLRSVVAGFMGLSSSSSSENTVAETTCAFLKSRCGVRQALYVPFPFPFYLAFIRVTNMVVACVDTSALTKCKQ